MEVNIKKMKSKFIPVLFSACALIFLLEALFLSYNKFFTIDEFQYAHAAWLCAQGKIPYRDFFDHHFPLLYQMFAIFFIFSNNPLTILILRGAMFFFLILNLLALGIINTKFSREYLSSILGIVFLLSCWPFITRAIEIRPDGVAFSLFISCLAILYLHKNKLNLPPLRKFFYPFAAGIVLALAVWSSQKVLVYGSPIAFFLLVDLIGFHKKKREVNLTGNPYVFLLGSGVIVLLLLWFLLLTGSLELMLYWCISFPMEMQDGFHGFSWAKYFFPGFSWFFWAVPLFLIGWFFSLVKLNKKWSPIELLLLWLPFSTFISYVIQAAPYDYSLIPFYAIGALYAGRGGGVIIEKLSVSYKLPKLLKITSLVIFVAVLAGAVLLNIRFFARFNEDNNHYQLKVLTRINELSNDNEVFFDNTGNFVSRRHAYYFYYNCQFMRDNWQDKYTKEIPQAIFASQCTWLFEDYRASELPKTVIAFITGHFVRYSPDLWVWGKKIKGKGEFLAVKEGDYFLYPLDIFKESEIRIGSRKIDSTIFKMKKGNYQVLSNGDKEFYIIYLPANRQPFKPDNSPAVSTFVR